MAWCTREMLIARAATERLPVFSADGLAEFVGCSAVASVIRSKRNAVIEPATCGRSRTYSANLVRRADVACLLLSLGGANGSVQLEIPLG